jgi:hypothetical protein
MFMSRKSVRRWSSCTDIRRAVLRQNSRSLNDGRFASVECQHDTDNDHRPENALLKIVIDADHVYAVSTLSRSPPNNVLTGPPVPPVSAVPPTTTAAIDFKK